MKHLHTYNNKLRNVNNCVDSFVLSLFAGTLFFPAWFHTSSTTRLWIGQTRGSSPAAIQFSFGNRANFHSRFLCCQCVFDPVPLGTLSLFSCAFEFSSNLICWRPKEIYRRAKNQCHCCGIYNFQRPDLICETPASDPATPPSMRFPCSREKSIRQKRRQLTSGSHRKGHMRKRLALFFAKVNITPDEDFKTEINSIKREVVRKFISALTKFHYRRVERNSNKLGRAKSVG